MNKFPLVSVIVPTYNSARTLEALLESIKRQDYQSIEIIVVDNGSVDETCSIASKYTTRVYAQGPERSAQRNRGALEATGQYLLFLDSDMQLDEHVVSMGVAQMQSNSILHALVIPERSFGIGFWAQCKALERSFYVGVDWMEAARFFLATTFKHMNGYDESNTGTEDYDLPQRIEAEFGAESIGRVAQYIFHDEGRISLGLTCRKKFYYAQRLSVYSKKAANATKFSNQSNPLRRYAIFFSRPRKLFMNPLLGLGMLTMKTCEFIAGAIGFLVSKVKTDPVDGKDIYKGVVRK